MTATIAPAAWLDFVQNEYLASFVKDGGTSIKFAVPIEEDLRREIDDGVIERAEQTGFICARVSAIDTRIHMIDQLFFRIAEQIPWQALSERAALRLARENGYLASPDPGPEPFVNRLAVANAIDPELLRMEARRWVSGTILKDSSLAKEFRVAMTHLCLAAFFGGPDGETTFEVITNWLTGRNRAISAVKPYQIFSRISRSNARHLLTSLLLWVRFNGCAGLAITLDIARVTVPRNPRDGQLYYTKAQLFDAYEVLRQFIDSTDRLKGCFFVVLPSEEFLDPDTSGRGMAIYNALKLRVYDEVRDQRLVNPMGALVRIAREGQTA